ncbi:MAG TPA: acyl-CoA carboxylase subunit beta [Anaerolineae bacterium]|nr:acyl-CoA carboxylase subunit beta [Caldilineae bacterium]HID35348.1 acyl-CoA carboxylase subunit beta [Anaerolineae bacterium]HIQ11598.1 acyl-CoA carboxylase subunit beta [Caldilineales bacterium]
MTDPLEQLRRFKEEAAKGGGEARIARQHAAGKLTARERIQLLVDAGSFQELGMFVKHQIADFGMDKKRYLGDAVVTGFATIDGRQVAVYAQDFTVLGGTFSEMHARKIVQLQDLALEAGIPIIGLMDSGGARIQEGVRGLAGYGDMFTRNVLSSGVIPQLSVMMGPSAGGSVYAPALTDFVIMVKGTSYMFLTGPDVVQAVTGETVSPEELGGAMVHNVRSGVAHFLAENEEHALEMVRLLISYLPQNNTEDPPHALTNDPPDRQEESLAHIVPPAEDQPYDVKEVIQAVVDLGSFFEVQPYFARNVVVGFARMDGFVVGIVANQPSFLAGVLDIDASDKIAHFVRVCDAFNIPILTFVDTPGFLPGVNQEHYGVIRHGAKIIYAYVEATVPKISIILRKAMGGAYIAMSSKQMRSDLALAWPTAQVAVMGAEGAVRILHRKDLALAEDPAQMEAEFVQAYRDAFFNPYVAAELGFIDDVIDPRETRPKLIKALAFLRTKVQQNPPKKHGLMPV